MKISKINKIENVSVFSLPSGKTKTINDFHISSARPDDFPDIDFDVAEPMRLKEILIEKYGKYSVVPITNFMTLKIRSLIKDISKFYGIPFQEVNEITTKILDEATGPAKKKNDIEAGAYEPTFEEAIEFSPTFRNFLEEYPQIGENIKNIARMPRSCFSDRVEILTDNGYKRPTEIVCTDKIAYMDKNEEIKFNESYDFIFQGEKQLFYITLENGEFLELTEDHEVRTQDGYKKVKDLMAQDIIYTIE